MQASGVLTWLVVACGQLVVAWGQLVVVLVASQTAGRGGACARAVVGTTDRAAKNRCGAAPGAISVAAYLPRRPW